MNYFVLTLSTTLLAVTVPTFSLTQSPDRSIASPVQPDATGDYYHNKAPYQGKADSPLMAGSLWQVVSVRLNCRLAPGNRQPIVRQFHRSAVLQVEVFRGGSDEVLLNPRDSDGKPWMPVRGKTPTDLCYVRANQRYIQPLLTQPPS